MSTETEGVSMPESHSRPDSVAISVRATQERGSETTCPSFLDFIVYDVARNKAVPGPAGVRWRIVVYVALIAAIFVAVVVTEARKESTTTYFSEDYADANCDKRGDIFITDYADMAGARRMSVSSQLAFGGVDPCGLTGATTEIQVLKTQTFEVTSNGQPTIELGTDVIFRANVTAQRESGGDYIDYRGTASHINPVFTEGPNRFSIPETDGIALRLLTITTVGALSVEGPFDLTLPLGQVSTDVREYINAIMRNCRQSVAIRGPYVCVKKERDSLVTAFGTAMVYTTTAHLVLTKIFHALARHCAV